MNMLCTPDTIDNPTNPLVTLIAIVRVNNLCSRRDGAIMMLRTAVRNIGAKSWRLGNGARWASSGGAARARARSGGEMKIAPPGDGPNHRSLMALDANTIRPYVQPDAFIAPSASVIGSVTINDRAAIMYGCVLRGDLALIHVGIDAIVCENTVITAGKVQEGALSPADAVAVGLPIEPEMVVGDFSYVGANCQLHSCMLDGDNVIGHGTVIERGARIGRYAEVLPGSWVASDVFVPDGEVWAGTPAVKVGTVSADEKTARRNTAFNRVKVTSAHLWEFLPYGTVYQEKEAIALGRSS